MRVVVFGAGYAGLTLARRLERTLPESAQLFVVDERDVHLVRHELHRAIRRPEVLDALEVPLSAVLDRATPVVGRIAEIDHGSARARFEAGSVPSLAGEDGTFEYDYGAICLGSETAFHGLAGVQEHGLPLERVPHALEIRDRFLELCESAAVEGETRRVVVGGGGLSGIQIAGELAALARESGVPVGTDGDPASDAAAEGVATGESGRVEIVLLEALEAVAPGFDDGFQRAIRSALERHGVRVQTGTTVDGATAGTVETDAGAVEADLFVWAGGIRGSDATGGTRPTVRADLRLSESTFVVGDAARVVDVEGRSVPATASAAIRESETAAKNLTRLVEHDLDGGEGFEPSLERYRFSVPGWAVSVGDEAIAIVGGQVVTGEPARKLKAAIAGGYLASNRAIGRAIAVVRAELAK